MVIEQYPKELFILKIESYLARSRSKSNGTDHYTIKMVIDEIINLLKITGLLDLTFPLNKIMGNDIPTLGRIR